ncbi:hypothetical protein [Variovorax saccharolyticus]|uniref:hypothetical protein n=1 Tax=Variovorax saccharolyticus TaxID=3053516 RepID=UPI002574B97C|nr:hypothetical protein [Variovorax sp. J31P216]MDM0029867.1 hypothetical protein [Variovorax sp. J31P216]
MSNNMSIEAIRQLAVAPLDMPDVEIERTKSVAGAPSAAINAGSIVGFSADISEQEQEDVLYSLQLAQRAASAATSRYTAVQDWYKEYVRVLEMTGWVMTGFNLNAQKVDQSEIEVAKAALEILAAAVTGPQSVVLLAAITAMKSMAKDDGFITLFEHFGAQGRVGNFQMSDVQKAPDEAGTLFIVTGAFQIEMAERQEKFLFFKWHRKGVSVWGDAVRSTFNRTHYATIREAVRERLGKEGRKAIAGLPLQF